MSDQFSIDTFQASIREVTKLPNAVVLTVNVSAYNISSYGILTMQRILLDDFGNLPMSGILVEYEIIYFTTEVRENATAAEAYSIVSQRLNNSLPNSYFSEVLRSSAGQFQSLSLINALTSFGDFVISPHFQTLFKKSAFPTGLPSSQPSTFPTSQPSSSPTSFPTFSLYTKYFLRLQHELENRLEIHEKEGHSVYFEMMADGIPYFGGKGTWSGFAESMIHSSLESKIVSEVTMVVINDTILPVQEFRCRERSAATDILRAMDLEENESTMNYTISCNNQLWYVYFCSKNNTTSRSPTVCVDCDDPCRESCMDKEGRLEAKMSPEYVDCEYGRGQVRIYNHRAIS